jgi:hypothetical protein
VFSESGLVGCEDGVDPDFKNAKRMVTNVQEGSWSAAGRPSRQAGRVIKASSADQVKGGNHNGFIITVESIGCSVFSLLG